MVHCVCGSAKRKKTMKARFIKQFKLDTPSGPLTINVGDEWTLTRTTDGSAVIVMGHGIQQKVPEEYFELPDRKVKESKTMKLTKAKLKRIIKEEIEAVVGEGEIEAGARRRVDAAREHLVNSVDSLIGATLEEDEFVLPDHIRENLTKKISDMIYEMLTMISKDGR